MRRSFRHRAMMTARLAAFLLAPLALGCARAAVEPPPVLLTWGEQFAEVEKAVRAKGGELELVTAGAAPVDPTPGAPAGLIELRGHFIFISPRATGVNWQGKQTYAQRVVRYNDHHLATTLEVESKDDATTEPPPPGAVERARLIRLGPQDALRLTRAEGEAHMRRPVDSGNMWIDLAMPDELPPDVKAPAVWVAVYFSEKEALTLFVDAQAGTILKRQVKEKK